MNTMRISASHLEIVESSKLMQLVVDVQDRVFNKKLFAIVAFIFLPFSFLKFHQRIDDSVLQGNWRIDGEL